MRYFNFSSEKTKPFNTSNRALWSGYCDQLEGFIASGYQYFNKYVRADLANFKKLLESSDEYLGLYHDAPKFLLKRLCKEVGIALAKYDYTYPVAQSPLVREVIMKLRKYANFPVIIKNTGLTARDSLQYANEVYRTYYMQLCQALLLAKKELLEGLEKNKQQKNTAVKELITLCETLFENTHVDPISERMQLITMDDGFALVRESKSEEKKEEKEDKEEKADGNILLAIENRTYKEALSILYSSISKYDLASQRVNNGLLISCQQGMHSIAKKIRRLIIDSEKKQPATFDKKFATNVLLCTNNLLENPHDVATQGQLFHLANFAEGRPSTMKKMQGLILALIGTALLATSILIGITLAGVSTPVTAFIMTLGWGLHLAGCGFTGLAGVATLIKANGVFNQGARTGLSEQIRELAKTTREEVNNPSFAFF